MRQQRTIKGILIKFCRRRIQKIKNMSRLKKVIYMIAGLALLCGVFIGSMFGNISANGVKKELKQTEAELGKLKKEKQEQETAKKEEKKKSNEKDRPWYLKLVNSSHPLEEGYVPKLANVEGMQVDERVAKSLQQMLADAREAGLSPIICSAYRSEEKQIQVFNDTVSSWVNQGYSYWEAYRRTTQEVAVPGTSEHSLGLAVDIVSSKYGELDEKQADTEEAKWLQENCTKYGFILRYPPDKKNETGIIYESWHYRYVGVEDAKKITKMGVTLEEYLDESY